MEKETQIKNLFKTIYGAMLDAQFNKVTEEEVVKISLKTVAQFANNNSVKINDKTI